MFEKLHEFHKKLSVPESKKAEGLQTSCEKRDSGTGAFLGILQSF